LRATSEFLGHLGIVAGVYDELGLAGVVDACLPKNRVHKVDNGVVLKALILNGLGFTERRLYMFPEYLEDMAVDRLLGEGVCASDFTDDVLGRFLDGVHLYGSTRLFNQMILEVMKGRCPGTSLLHVDTTSFSVYGEYEDEDGKLFELTVGHPKDGRWDLNRFVLSLVSNQHGVPLYMKALSGNSSDKKSLVETIEYVRSHLCFDERVYYVADSAFYSDENLGRVGAHTFWVSRVPGTIEEAKRLLDTDVVLASSGDPRYRFYETTSGYGGILQKWVLFQSSEMQGRMEKTFDKNVEKELQEAKASLKHVCGVLYYCREDALQAADKWLGGFPRLEFENVDVVTVSRRKDGRKGRPRNGEELQTWFKIEATVHMKKAVVAEERLKLGRFVLATNDTDLSADKLLEYYKGQGAVERGFRFLKDRDFRVSEVFLKKPERIEALAMVMVLSLFVYSFAEWKLREQMARKGETVLSQLRKPTGRPTLKWVFSSMTM
jgi:transposase